MSNMVLLTLLKRINIIINRYAAILQIISPGSYDNIQPKSYALCFQEYVLENVLKTWWPKWMKYTIWIFGRLETQLFWKHISNPAHKYPLLSLSKNVIIWVICVICLAPNLSNRSSRDGHFLTQFLKAQVIINNLKQRSVG